MSHMYEIFRISIDLCDVSIFFGSFHENQSRKCLILPHADWLCRFRAGRQLAKSLHVYCGLRSRGRDLRGLTRKWTVWELTSSRCTHTHTHTVAMLLGVVVISVALVIFVLKYVFGNSGPNPFEKDTREPLKPMVHNRKEKNKVLKQGESKGHLVLT